jgi:alkylhydroperoxidase family enzyme
VTISTDDVRRLLQSDEPDSRLVLVEGRMEVIGAGQLASEQYRGALEVISRDDLVKRLGDVPSEHATTSPERQHFDVPQMVELTHIVALENLRARFNLALDIGSARFSEGMVCALPG